MKSLLYRLAAIAIVSLSATLAAAINTTASASLQAPSEDSSYGLDALVYDCYAPDHRVTTATRTLCVQVEVSNNRLPASPVTFSSINHHVDLFRLGSAIDLITAGRGDALNVAIPAGARIYVQPGSWEVQAKSLTPGLYRLAVRIEVSIGGQHYNTATVEKIIRVE